MNVRSIVFAALIGAFSLCFAGTGFARTVKIVPKDAIATIELPNDWKVTEVKRGIEVRSGDEEVYLWFEVYAAGARDAVVAEHESYFKTQGVVIAGEPKIRKTETNGVTTQITDFPATWQGGPTVLRYVSIDLGLSSSKQVLLSYWASPEGDRTHDAAMRRLVDSFAPL